MRMRRTQTRDRFTVHIYKKEVTMSSKEEIETFIHGLKVTDLKDELRKRSLNANGLKAALVQRLKEAMMSELDDESQEEPANKPEEENEEVNVEELGGEEGTNNDDKDEVIESNLLSSESSQAVNVVDNEEQPLDDSILDVEITEPSTEENTEDEAEKETVTAAEEPMEEEKVQEQKELKNESDNNEEPVNETSNVNEEIADKEESSDPPVQQDSSDQPIEATKEDNNAMEFTVEDTAGIPSQDETPDVEKTEEGKEEVKNDKDEKGEEEVMEHSNNKEDVQEKEGEEESDARGIKRTREADDDNDDDKDNERERRGDKRRSLDPRDMPDPESVPDWEDETVQAICANVFTLPEDSSSVTLNPYKSDLHFIINSDGLGGAPLTEGGFAYIRASSKATWGIKSGSFFFECKIEEKLPVTVKEGEEEEDEPHVIRVGWSSLDSAMIAGDDKYSYCYECTGKKVSRSEVEDYGETCDEGDVIGCYVNISDDSKTIFFTKNGTNLGEAFNLTEQNIDCALFPHVSTKNIRVSFNFGANPPSFPAEEGYSSLQEATEEQRECVSTAPVAKSDCEVILMIGLPGCGKTYWCSKHSSRNTDKSYRILGPYQLFDQMIMKKKSSITEWKDFVELTTPMMNTLCVLASKLPCNYIIDQVNVFRESQKQKMSLFEGFYRRCLVVIPPHHELRKRRVDRIRDGKCMELPQDALDAFKANFHIPKQEDGFFDEINYSEIYGPASDKIVRQYKDDALGLPTPYLPSKKSRYESRSSSSSSRHSYGYSSSSGSSYSSSYSSSRSKGGSYNYGPYGGSSSRYYPPPSRSYYPPPPPPPHHYRNSYYPPPPPPSYGGGGGGGWGHRGRYNPPPLPPPPPPHYGGPRPYYRGGGSSSSYYNRY